MNLKAKNALYRKALRGAKYALDAQEEELRKLRPNDNLIIQPSREDIATVSHGR